jgi:hypothetical protein
MRSWWGGMGGVKAGPGAGSRGNGRWHTGGLENRALILSSNRLNYFVFTLSKFCPGNLRAPIDNHH